MPTSSSRQDQPAARCSQPGTPGPAAGRARFLATRRPARRRVPGAAAVTDDLLDSHGLASPPAASVMASAPVVPARPGLPGGRAISVAQSCPHVTNYGGPMRVYRERLRVPGQLVAARHAVHFPAGRGIPGRLDRRPAAVVYGVLTLAMAARAAQLGAAAHRGDGRGTAGRPPGPAAAGPGRPGHRAGRGPDPGAARPAGRPGRVPAGPAVPAAGGVHRGRRPGRVPSRTG